MLFQSVELYGRPVVLRAKCSRQGVELSFEVGNSSVCLLLSLTGRLGYDALSASFCASLAWLVGLGGVLITANLESATGFASSLAFGVFC